MVPILFAAFLMLSVAVALLDWRRGWYLALLCGVLQDPVRKLTPGSPVYLTFSVVLIYLLVLLAAHHSLADAVRDLNRRFPNLAIAGMLFLLFLMIAAANGLITFGLALWKAPALSFIIYTIPIPAFVVGYVFFRRDEYLVRFFIFEAVLTSIALVGVILEYRGLNWRALGLVGQPGLTIRYLPGMEIRMLSGFYRAPDIMAWHAAMLTMIGITMALRIRLLRVAWPWMLVAGWGLLGCFLSGRRKAVYMVVVFVAVFVWRYARRLTVPQAISFLTLGFLLGFVIHNIATSEATDVYVRGQVTTQEELLGRLEGGLNATVEQFGFMGAGLGTATQGTQHLGTGSFGWQEGGLGKLALELGVPGLIAVVIVLITIFNLMLQITRAPDEEGTSQVLRCALMAMMVANFANFLASAQAYSDPVLTLMTAFFGGCLFATAATQSRLAQAAQEPVPARSFRSQTA